MKEIDDIIGIKFIFNLKCNKNGDVIKMYISYEDHYGNIDYLGYVDDPISIKYYMDKYNIRREIRKEKLDKIKDIL